MKLFRMIVIMLKKIRFFIKVTSCHFQIEFFNLAITRG